MFLSKDGIGSLLCEIHGCTFFIYISTLCPNCLGIRVIFLLICMLQIAEIRKNLQTIVSALSMGTKRNLIID